MPLLDHFQPPLKPHRDWHSFHSAWASCLAFDLNKRLPERYYAEPNVHFGIEIDVATLEATVGASAATATAGDAETSISTWNPPAPTQTIPLTVITDIVQVDIFRAAEGSRLVGAIELVSPANKDRPAHRDTFVQKCATYLREGVGLIVVDVVTERNADLHGDLLAVLGENTMNGDPAALYAAAYRPVDREDQINLDIWHESLTIDNPLPTLPMWLRGGLCLPIDFESTYQRTRQELRIR